MSSLVFGKYEVLRRIAIGGMGEIFHAVQRRGPPAFERPVVLKSLLPELAAEQAFVDQFFDEARLVSQLDHPNVVSVYEYGEWEGQFFIAMEFIKGCTLSQLLRACKRHGRALPWRVVAQIGHDAALGLHHVHCAADASGTPLGIVHRDVSPQNLMIREDGVVKLLDFGIARATVRAARTDAGAVKGKLAYLAPEQLNLEPVTAHADQFSLGVVLWELITQRRLFEAPSEAELIELVRRCSVPPVDTLVADLPDELTEVVRRLTQRAPADRFSSAQEVAGVLARMLNRSATGAGRIANSLPHQTVVAELMREVGVSVPTHQEARLPTSSSEAVTVATPSAPGAQDPPTRAQASLSSPSTADRPAGQARLRVGIALGVAVALGVAGLWGSLKRRSSEVLTPLPPERERAALQRAQAQFEPAPGPASSEALVTVICPNVSGTGVFVAPSRVVAPAAVRCASARVRLADGRTLLGSVVRELEGAPLLELEVSGDEGAPLKRGSTVQLQPGARVWTLRAGTGTFKQRSPTGPTFLEVELDVAPDLGAPLVDGEGRLLGVMVDATHALSVEEFELSGSAPRASTPLAE